MPRSDRLFRLLHLLRTLPRPVTAGRLAQETGVSERTVYRDIEALRAGGALVDGEPGYGYSLTEDPALPPQTFDRLEIEALVLGLAQVRQMGDPALATAAEAALGKITATLPEQLQRQAMHAVLRVHRFEEREPPPEHVITVLRGACWEEFAVDVCYVDAGGQRSQRRIWPLSIVFLDRVQMLLAWCCLRQDFRKFLLTRIEEIAPTDQYFRPRRVPLLREYIARLSDGCG